jgi:hypothetical protein
MVAIGASEVQSAARPAERVEFAYTLRGYALFWFVLDHAMRATEQLFHDPWLVRDQRSLFDIVDDITEGTRLPLLMFLAALFVERGLRHGLRDFLDKRLRYLAWPWLLWTAVGVVTLNGMGRLGLEVPPIGYDHFVSMLWRPYLQTWFLYDLLVFNLVFLAAWRLGIDRRIVLAVAVALFVASLCVDDVDLSGIARAARHVGRWFLFYWLGIMLPEWSLTRGVERQPMLLWCSAVVFFLLAVPPVLLGAPWWHLTTVASGLPALPLMLWIGPRLADTALRPALGWAGRASLQILCLHFPLVWAIVAGAAALGWNDPIAVAALALSGTLAACYAFDRASQRWRFAPALGFGLRL